MANLQFKLGSAECELITGITFSNTNQKTVAHSLGVIPDMVIITNTTSGYNVYQTATSTATSIYLTPSNASATCDVLLIKAKDPEIA